MLSLEYGKMSFDGGGADLSEYFDGPIIADGTEGSWKNTMLKFPALEMQGNDCYRMFRTCPVKEIDCSLFDTSNVSRFSEMFSGCTSLETLNISSFDFSKVTGLSSSSTIASMFLQCDKLTNLTFGVNLGKGFASAAGQSRCTLTLSDCTLLTHDSLMSVINNLYDISDKNTQKLVLGDTNLAKLTQEEIAIATNKGWTVS